MRSCAGLTLWKMGETGIGAMLTSLDEEK